MNSSFKERLARLGPVRAVRQVHSGSPAVMSLRPETNPKVNAITAAQALARRGLSLLRAKRAVEEMISSGRAVIEVPKVESRALLTAELAESGIIARSTDRNPDIRRLRESMKLTQEQFAVRFGFDLDTLQNWERKRRKPDKAVWAYLRVIERLPEAASEAQEDLEMPVERTA
jgi:DNA-binding transcriptional regulator YiaG